THTPSAGRGLRGTGRRGFGGLGADALSQGKDVLCDLTLTVADDEGDSAVHGQYECSPVGNDGVRDLAAQARLDIRGLDAARAVVAVRDELHLIAAVSELLGDLHPHAHLLDARDR